MLETIYNRAEYHDCRCPICNSLQYRGYEETIFFCRMCGNELHARAFTQEEIKEALLQNEMDDYED